MSSGEKAKPPATFEERNPFDISRRSGPEVAAEIAKRMSAWKQARVRTTTTIPEATSRIDVKSPPVAKSPPIAAPVQPARMPKSAPPAPQPAPASTAGGSSTLRVPYFASASATRRAMPPAPSLKQGSQRQPDPGPDELVAALPEPAMPIAAPVLEQPPLDATDPAMTKEEAAVAEPAAAVEADAAAAPPDPVESPLMAQASAPVEPDDSERRRAEARAIKARWIAAHDLDGLLDTSAAETAPAGAAAAHEEGGGEGAETSEQLAEEIDSPLPDERPDDAGGEELLLDEPAAPEIEEPAVAPERIAATRGPIAVSAGTTERLEPMFDVVREASAHDPAAPGRKDPTFDAPVVQQTSESAREPGIVPQDDAADGRGAEAAATEPADSAADEGLSIAALDEVAGRKEPTFDKPVQHAAPKIEPPVELQEEAATQSRADEPIATYDNAPEEGRAVESALSIAALDEVAGRKEPTFDKPVQQDAPQLERPAPVETQEEVATQPRAEESSAAAVAPEDNRAAEDQLSIAALDEAAGRKEPTFDEPVPPAKPAAVPPAAPRIALRPIETRIEVRRIDTLRADPPLSARRPIFPHIEPEEWDIAPMAAVQAHRARRGTGWAIGLGTVLLVAGITAPAAIWQQGRQAQDQVALVDPAPAPQQVQTPAPAATAAAQATLPAAPQPETPAPAPAVTAQDSGTPSAPDQAAPKPEQVAANPKPATTLGAVSDGGDVNESPVMTPPPPTVKLASKTEGADVMTARPFVPEQGDGPFLRAPTTGAATVPVTGAPVQSAAVGVKPNLMGQLKPRGATTVSAAKPVVSKTKPARTAKPFFQQSPEQMFNTLIDTLSEGKPVNPATKPASPSNRR